MASSRAVAERRDPGEELLAAIIAAPDDVERRLVYADWLLEQGDPRGELIHLCERKLALDQRDEDLDARIDRLEREHGPRIAGFIHGIARKYRIARGFVWSVELTAKSFASHGDRILAQHPIERVDLGNLDPEALALFASTPAVRRLRGLQLCQLGSLAFDELCRGTMFESLRHLEIWGWHTKGDPLDGFARWEAPRLRSMTLFHVDTAPRIVAGLARNEVVQMRHLSVCLMNEGSWSGATLAAPAFAQLRALRLQSDEAGVEELLEGAELPDLEILSIEDSFASERVAFAKLQRLSLRGPVRADELEGLLARHPRLEWMEISEMDPGEVDRVLEVALALPREHPLERLVLPSRARDRGLEARARRRFGSKG